jgi:hypothetical protein
MADKALPPELAELVTGDDVRELIRRGREYGLADELTTQVVAEPLGVTVEEVAALARE